MIKSRSGKMYLKFYGECKYQYVSDTVNELQLDGVEAFEVITGEHGKEIGAEMLCSGISKDPFNEYLRIYFENGETATYRNSFVDLFQM